MAMIIMMASQRALGDLVDLMKVLQGGETGVMMVE